MSLCLDFGRVVPGVNAPRRGIASSLPRRSVRTGKGTERANLRPGLKGSLDARLFLSSLSVGESRWDGWVVRNLSEVGLPVSLKGMNLSGGRRDPASLREGEELLHPGRSGVRGVDLAVAGSEKDRFRGFGE